MRFRSHQCWFPKDADFPGDYEDASARSEKHGRAIVADGVSSAIFSRTWARLLTRSAVAEPPDLTSEDAIQAWLAPLQQEWRKGINFAGLPWHQKPKATSIGAQTTLLAVSVEPLADGGDPSAEYSLRASGIGDCVLFLVRDGRKVFSFPLTSAAQFAEPPHIFSSIAKGVAYVEKFRYLDDRCCIGDLLIVCSDAVGLWAMEEYEAGREVDWMRYWENDEAWQEDIQALRARRADEHGNRMRVDDCTLLLLQVVAEETLADEPDVQPDRSDEPFVLFGALASTETSTAATATGDAGSRPTQAVEGTAAASEHEGISAPADTEGTAANTRQSEARGTELAAFDTTPAGAPPSDPLPQPPTKLQENAAPAAGDPTGDPIEQSRASEAAPTILDYLDGLFGRFVRRDGTR
jgi:hypothetical protein